MLDFYYKINYLYTKKGTQNQSFTTSKNLKNNMTQAKETPLVVMCGGPRQSNFMEAKSWFKKALQNLGNKPLKLITGGAQGADRAALKAAQELGIENIQVYWPDYAKHKQGATHRRNDEMANACELAIIYIEPGVKMNGTRSQLKKLAKRRKPIVRSDSKQPLEKALQSALERPKTELF